MISDIFWVVLTTVALLSICWAVGQVVDWAIRVFIDWVRS
jgi:hypothetical protein